jgi:very-short-patch-repair endonuclease
MPSNYTHAEKLAFAREMRKKPTPAERQLWYHLRERRLGYKFHRQAQVAGYIVDIYCPSARVAIEIDGSIHDLLIVKAKDAEKERVLEERGVCVLRFVNEDVLGFTTVVINRIKSACDERRALKALSGAGDGGGLSPVSSRSSVGAKHAWTPLEQRQVQSKLKEFSVQDAVRTPPTAEDIAAINQTWRKLVRRSTVRSEMSMVDRANDQKLRLKEWLKKRSESAESAALTVKGMHVTERKQA